MPLNHVHDLLVEHSSFLGARLVYVFLVHLHRCIIDVLQAVGLISMLFPEVYSVDLRVSLGVHGLAFMPLGPLLLFKPLELSLIFCIV